MAKQNGKSGRTKVTPIRKAEPDVNQLAHHAIRTMTERVADSPSDADIKRVMAELGRRGGRTGGMRRAANMTAEERSNAASLAARARWKKAKKA
jgi:hypothetical protein